MGLRQKYLKSVVDSDTVLTPRVSTGTADIDISAAVYTGFVTLLTVTPASGDVLQDLTIDLAYNKATTGVSAVATNADTLDVAAFAMADDATESQIASVTQRVLTGSATPTVTGDRLQLGPINGAVTVKVKLSAERADAEIPYKVTYRSLSAATITPVAAG